MNDVPATVDDATESLQSGYENLKDHYELPVLLVVVLFMLWVRLQAMGNFISGEKVYFAGNDAYYHLREVNYVVRHWPFTMPFDPWTYFPYGSSQGQFGTLFDQLIATTALILGLGNPGEHLVAEVVVVAPAVFGSLVAIPTFYIARRLAGIRAGLMAAVLLALLPGTFLQRGLVGFADHNIAEVLFQTTAVFAVMVALSIAEREQPVYELVLDHDWEALRQPALASGAAGVALFAYVWLWPPAVVLVAILGVFFVLAISLHVYHGRNPESLVMTGAVSMGLVSVMSLLAIDTLSLSTTAVSPLQIIVSAAVGIGCLYMARLAREVDHRELESWYFIVSLVASILLAIATLTLLLPQVWELLITNFLRTFAFGQTDTTLTIAEAQSIPLESAGRFLYRQYGLLFLSAIVGIATLAITVTTSRDYDPEDLLVVVWALAITLMAFTQVRFNYYLAVVIAILSAVIVERFLGWIDLPSDVRHIESFQLLALLAAFVIVLAPLLPPLATAHVVAVGQANGPGAVVTWTESLDWMEDNTPAEGRYGGASNELAYYGTFERTDDFAYPTGSYGVMSWWDYGHWITVEGERIPNANPFQQGPRPSSAFLLAQNETRANLILEALPSRDQRGAIPSMSTEELRATIAAQTPQQASEDTRYVMIDDQMAAGKFGAIATWTGPGSQIYFDRQEFQVGGSQANLIGPNDRYHGTMLARLYFRDASGLSHYRLVHETNRTSSIVSVARNTQQGWTSDLNGDGRPGDFINRRLSSSVFNAVQQNPQLAFYDVRQAATVKTFERVPGATLVGQVGTDNATTVFATLKLRTNTGRNVTYVNTVQTDGQGNFAVTVPYATTDSVKPVDGGTDSAVEAKGRYQVFAGNPFQPSATGNVSVPEPAVYGGETIEVRLEAIERPTGNRTNATNHSVLGTDLPFDSSSSLDGPVEPTISSPVLGGLRWSTVLAAEARGVSHV